MAIMGGLDMAQENETPEDMQAHDLVSQIERLEAEAPHTKALDRCTFPHAHTIDYYDQLFKLSNISETRGLALITATMHPSPWLAARHHNMSVVVWGPRTTMHSQKHGLALAISVRLTRYLTEAREDPNPSVVSSTLQFIQGPQVDALSQVLEPFDVSRGNAWFEGLNPILGPAQLNKVVLSLQH